MDAFRGNRKWLATALRLSRRQDPLALKVADSLQELLCMEVSLSALLRLLPAQRLCAEPTST